MAKGKQRYNYLVGPKFEKKYKIGKYHTLLIQRNGFTLWDDRDGRWILDASTFVSGSEITVVTNKFKQFADKWMHKRTFVLRKPNK